MLREKVVEVLPSSTIRLTWVLASIDIPLTSYQNFTCFFITLAFSFPPGLHILPSLSIFFINFIFSLTRIHVSKHPSLYLTAIFLRSNFSFHLEANIETTWIASIVWWARKDKDCKAERVRLIKKKTTLVWFGDLGLQGFVFNCLWRGCFGL